jgi:citrate lyase subunit beta/citryl-CoA lyase
MINASFSVEADSLIFDLEDAVHISEKDSARILLRNALPLFNGRNIAIRINANDDYWMEDLELFRLGIAHNVVVPKARAEQIKQISALLDDMNADVDIEALIESADSLEELSEICRASKRVRGLLMGGEDYSLDLGVERTRKGDEILFARTKIANVARAYDLESLDTPFSDVQDEDGLMQDAKFAKGIGYTGKLSINPLQVKGIQKVFRPEDKEIKWAQKILDAAGMPENVGLGAFSLDGKMIDLPVIKRAEKTIQRAGIERNVL